MDTDPLSIAVAELAELADARPDDIVVVSHERVTWRNSSAGCPQPGMMYAQMLVEGYRIILRTGDEEVTYHGRRGEPPFRCDDPDPNGAVEVRPLE